MSALGHKQTYALQKAMSALPLKADIPAKLSAMGQNRTQAIITSFRAFGQEAFEAEQVPLTVERLLCLACQLFRPVAVASREVEWNKAGDARSFSDVTGLARR